MNLQDEIKNLEDLLSVKSIIETYLNKETDKLQHRINVEKSKTYKLKLKKGDYVFVNFNDCNFKCEGKIIKIEKDVNCFPPYLATIIDKNKEKHLFNVSYCKKENIKNQDEKDEKDKENKIYEIRIRHMNQISEIAKKEILEQVEKLPKTFNFIGYVAISYAQNPFRIVKIEPIEGTINTYLDKITKGINVNVFEEMQKIKKE